MCVDDADSWVGGAQAHAAGPWVLKIGGRLVEDEGVRRQFAHACAQLAHPCVIVHGGGCVVTDLQAALGIRTIFHAGRRVTRPEDMDAVEMALSGVVNKHLVRALLMAGRSAVGVSGCDAAMVRCSRVPALGAVGLPQHVDTALVQTLLADDRTPVISPVSLGPDGEPLNVNADEMACALATALRAARLLLISDVAAVQVAGGDRAAIGATEIEALITAGEVTGGMVPKLRSAGEAVRAGVGAVWIGGFQPNTGLGALGGTTVVAAAGE